MHSGGRIAAVGSSRDLRQDWPRARRVELPGCALLPALVNAHAHLELTALGEVPPGGDFVGWVLEVVRRKGRADAEAWA
ncbi:MAG: amidohydrolase family protein, partial [Deferrisomatales bacterium]